MRPYPDRQQQRFEERAALQRQAYAAPPPLTAAERAEFCGCKRPDHHGADDEKDSQGVNP